MISIDPRYAYKNQTYYNNFKSERNNNDSALAPVAVNTNDNRVNFGEHGATPFTSKVIDFVKKLVTGDIKNQDNTNLVSYYA